MSQQHESIWGTINTTLEIALNVFYLVGDEGAGMKMPASYGKNPRLQKFLEMGDRDGDYLYFPETGKGYEELEKAVCEDYVVGPVTMPQIESEIQKDEKYTGYVPDALANENLVIGEGHGNADEDEGENEYDGFEPY